MTTTTSPNGRPQRKQLSDQLDRFDTILNGLSEGLNESIADAVRDGTRLALKDAVIEILTDPTLRARLQQAACADVPRAEQVLVRPALWQRLKAKCQSTGAAVGQMAAHAVQTTVGAARTAAKCVSTSLRGIELFGSLKRLFLIGAGVGATLALASFLAPHVASATLSGIGGAVAAMAVQVSLWMRRAFKSISFA